ncbi:hypothetical protein C9374_014520 [Naegleria lovaniensis]|uniref:Uncharacterized protein n=1 Tax=Naegleria lovaniensis TaxID=51637 RepID=A0AA88GUI0_NAELO|nr:uncharacterized protein C9374_014520 [Naegleria lovaniensis]KAG2389120.1 hypothetical protein C9374_014520 [Naegleria lovaniensis]
MLALALGIYMAMIHKVNSGHFESMIKHKSSNPHHTFHNNTQQQQSTNTTISQDPKVICISNELLYIAKITHHGNLHGLMKASYETMFSSEIAFPFKKDNFFIFSDQPFSERDYSQYTHATLVQNTKGSGYNAAQQRFIESLYYMLDKRNERNDSKVHWFILSDDDMFMISRNLFRVIGKYERKISNGELDMNQPLIIGRSTNCRELSGGASVIFNDKAILLLKKHLDACIAKFGLEYFDLTIYKCVSQYIPTQEPNLDPCKVLNNEHTMHALHYMYYCDPSSYQDPPNLSWYDRFRFGAGFHYIKHHSVQPMTEIIPTRLLRRNQIQCFNELAIENDFYGRSEPLADDTSQVNSVKISELIQKVPPQDFIQWDKKEQHQSDPEKAALYMENLHQLIFSHWNNHFLKNRKKLSGFLSGKLSKNDVAVLVMPSDYLNSRKKIISPNYDLWSQYDRALSYWKDSVKMSKVLGCRIENPMSQKDSFKQCLNGQLAALANSKWVLVVSESTKVDINLLLQYLETFPQDNMLYIGAFSSAQEMLLSPNEDLGLPFGAGFVVSMPFVNKFQELASSENTKFSIYDQLLTPNKNMILSGGHFFRHAPEFYCVNGVQNLESWIEMKVKTADIEPMMVTFTPTSTCLNRWGSIDEFFRLQRHTVFSPMDNVNRNCFD